MRTVVDGAVARGLSPDLFTLAGLIAAGFAAVAIWQGWWLAALGLLAARLAGANLDGAVARARGVSRPWGFVLNEIGDRGSDLVMFLGLVALAARTAPGWTSWPVLVTMLAATAATLPTLASLAAAGAGAPRRNGGPLGKTERCALAVLATAVPSWITGIALVVIAGSVATAAVRLRATWRDLTRRDPTRLDPTRPGPGGMP